MQSSYLWLDLNVKILAAECWFDDIGTLCSGTMRHYVLSQCHSLYCLFILVSDLEVFGSLISLFQENPVLIP